MARRGRSPLSNSCLRTTHDRSLPQTLVSLACLACLALQAFPRRVTAPSPASRPRFPDPLERALVGLTSASPLISGRSSTLRVDTQGLKVYFL